MGSFFLFARLDMRGSDVKHSMLIKSPQPMPEPLASRVVIIFPVLVNFAILNLMGMLKLDEILLKKYARVMVHYALNNGHGINKGDTVFLVGQECAKDLFLAIASEIY